MKKTIISVCFFFILFFKVSNLSAQTPEATFLNSNGLKKNEILRLQIKDDLKLTEAKFDSVAVIQKDYQYKARQIKLEKKLDENFKQKRLKELIETKSKRLKAAGLDDLELKKVVDYFINKNFPQ